MSRFDWEPYLENGEEVLWQGRPDQRFRMFLSLWDIFLVPFFAIWTVVSGLIVFGLVLGVLAFLTAKLANEGPVTFLGPLELIPLALIFPLACYVFVGRSILDRRLRSRTRYAVTNRRALKVEVEHPRRLTAKPITPDVTVDVTLGKLTTLRLDPWIKANDADSSSYKVSLIDPFGMKKHLIYGYVEQGFELRLLPDGRDVAKLIRDLKSQLAKATP